MTRYERIAHLETALTLSSQRTFRRMIWTGLTLAAVAVVVAVKFLAP